MLDRKLKSRSCILKDTFESARDIAHHGWHNTLLSRLKLMLVLRVQGPTFCPSSDPVVIVNTYKSGIKQTGRNYKLLSL